MKSSALTFTVLFLSTAVSAGSFFQQSSGLRSSYLGSAAVGLAVPGTSPLYFCGDTSNDLATIEKVNMIPNPPAPGATLNIEATGVLHDVITTGAMVDITVKYGLITLLRESLDLCENAGQVDLKCPVDQGKLVLNKSVDIPSQIPPGTYTVIANAYTVDGRPIVCLTATVKFYT